MKPLSLSLVAMLVFIYPVYAQQLSPQGTAQETPQVAKIKAEVQKRGTGKDAKVKVTLGNDVKVKGYIGRIDESSFEVIASKTNQATSISYTEVQKVQGPGMSTGAKIAIVAAVVVVTAVVIAVAARPKINLHF